MAPGAQKLEYRRIPMNLLQQVQLLKDKGRVLRHAKDGERTEKQYSSQSIGTKYESLNSQQPGYFYKMLPL